MTPKRFFDLSATLLGLIVLTPVFLVIPIVIMLQDGGPAFFRQERIGQWGKPFKIWKFRSMVLDAAKTGECITIGNDPRITPFGSWIRKYKIDELPQLFNVLCGQMSLVGPRPEIPAFIKFYNNDQRAVLLLLPGITDPASLKYRNESEILAQKADPHHAYVNEILPDKININLKYAANAGLLSDIKVIFYTLGLSSPPSI